MLSSVEKSGEKLICSAYYDYNGNNQITSAENNCNNNKITHTVNTYDKNGNLVKTECEDTETVKDYTYDNENRLKAIKENGTLLMAALYDGNGDRIFRLDYRKTASYISNKAGTAENVYYPTSSVNKAYDADVIMDEMLIPNGVTNNTAINYELTGYINDINTEYTQTLMEFGANGGTTNIYEYGENREIATINGTKSYYMYDGRGSVASLTGSSSSNLVSYTYDAYGEETKSNNTLNNPYRYNAEYTDSSTGYQYLRARYYDPATGRFLTKDTYLGKTEYPLSKNLYTYCYNNPLYYTDPSGHIGIIAALAISVAVGAVAGAASGGISNAISQHKGGGEFDSKSFWRSVGIGAAAGAVGGLVGGAAGAATGAIIGAVGGSTTGMATGVAVGAASGISGGMAYRYTETKLNNAVNGKNDSALKAAYNPIGIAVDGILGGIGGAIGAGVAAGKIKNPFKNTTGTKGEQQAAKAYIESVKKYCGENGAEYIDAQEIEPHINVPESAATTPKTISSNALKHINNSHNPNVYAKQLAYKPIDEVMNELNKKSFFNSGWTKDYINNAVNYGYEQALQNGYTNGTYQYSYFGEEITIYMKNGQVDTAYGNYHYTYEELLELLK